jgi:hypothetical protein
VSGAKLRQRRRREKEQRHAASATEAFAAEGRQLAGPVESLAYTREQAAQALGISLATLDRRVVPAIATVKTEWGARLIPVGEVERYLAERREEPRPQRRQSAISPPAKADASDGPRQCAPSSSARDRSAPLEAAGAWQTMTRSSVERALPPARGRATDPRRARWLRPMLLAYRVR